MIAINATVWDSRPSGLGVIARELTARIAGIRKDTAVFCSGSLCPDAAIHKVSPWVCGRHGPVSGGTLRFLWTQTVLPFRLKALGAKVLLSPNHEAMLFPPCAQAVAVHDLLPLLYPESYPRQRLYYRRVFPMILRKAEAIVALSENTKKDLVRHYGLPPSKITVVYPGVDHGLFRPVPGASASEPYILFVGNQYPYKNIRGLLEAFSGLVREGCSHRLFLAGGKQPPHAVDALGLGDRVRSLDYVARDDLPRLYSQADLLVLPSLYEGFGLPALEAMACGCPVAVSRTSSLPEVCGEAACYFDPVDPSDIKRAISEVLSDRTRRERMIASGLAQAAKFRWEDTAKAYVGLLTRLERDAAP
ncbi:MAG: glycosyltransferase family 1 protein [Elusimicrobiota bacterium]